MKKIVMVVVIATIFTASMAIACPLPVDVKIQKVVSNNKLTPADAVMSARLRSQLRTAFSCRNEKNTAREVGREVVNVELVEIIHQGYSTRVNVATDRGFFSEKVINYGFSHREKLEAALKLVADSISEAVCK